MTLPRIFVIIALLLLLFNLPGQAQTVDVYGQVGVWDGECGITDGMDGITVLLYDEGHTVEYETVTYTDEPFASSLGRESSVGMYIFDDVLYREDYVLEVLAPLGVDFATNPAYGSWWNANPRTIGTSFYRCFLMVEAEYCPDPEPKWWWKYQTCKTLCGWGCAQFDYDEYQTLLDLIYEHFDGTEYFPVEGVSSVNGEPLTPDDAWDTFTMPSWCGPDKQQKRAKKQLLALLLNVAAEYIPTWEEISNDDRTVSEAINYCADQINNNGNWNKAKKVARKINKEKNVPSGWIPDGYGLIYFGDEEDQINVQEVMPSSAILIGNYPNPFNPETQIRFNLPEASDVTLAIYNLQGQLIEEIVSGNLQAGLHTGAWNANGYPSGTYIYRLTSDMGAVSGKMLLLK